MATVPHPTSGSPGATDTSDLDCSERQKQQFSCRDQRREEFVAVSRIREASFDGLWGG